MNRSLGWLAAGICLCMSWFSYGMEPDSLVRAVMDGTSLDSLLASVRILSGEDSVRIDGAMKLILDRGDGQGNDLAATYLAGKLGSYHLDVHEDTIGDEARNVVAFQPGVRFPEKQYIFCAHFDAVGEHGADDNASGVAAVLEAARLLSRHYLDYTVIYAFWDQEEMGYLGSAEYASGAKAGQDEILGVINLDMIGWDGDGDRLAEIHSSDVAGSDSLARLLQLTDSIYGTELELTVYNPGISKSDHGSFWKEGFGAIMLIEEWYGDDYNPYYHTDGDRVVHFDTGYFHEMSRLAIGSISILTGMNGEPSISVTGNPRAYPADSAEVRVNGVNTLFTYHQDSPAVWLSRANDSISARQVTVLDDTSVSALFHLSPEAAPGSWDVNVLTAAHGKLKAESGFRILPFPARLEVSTDTMGFSVDSGGIAEQSLLLLNSGGSDLRYSVACYVPESRTPAGVMKQGWNSDHDAGTGPWLSAEPDSGSCIPGSSNEIEVLADASMMMPGEYSGLVAISSNDSLSPLVEIPVGLEVTPSGFTGDPTGHPAGNPSGAGISMFPNPAGDVLFIESGYSGTLAVGITSPGSRSFTSRVVDGPSCRIDLASLGTGVYFITVRAGSLETTRVIIRH